MAQKQLNAVVVIGGRTDSSFSQIGDALISMGNAVDGVSQKLIDFGKESLEVYSDYEYNMRTVEEIWGSNGTFASGSRELKSAMKQLSDSAADWAANSIFHTDDVSNALVEAAHAGWGLEEMLNGIPSAMKLAQAGDMDLSTSLDYVLKSMKSLGMEYGNLDNWIDEWVYASNKSAGTAEEFGDTFLRMGSTMRYAADPEEILALTAIMHNMGATGSEAGTMVRNSMLRLLAPSGVASKVLEQLGATDDEIKEIREDSSKLAALNQLEANGFSAFDENGQAKSIVEIYSSLGDALADIAGGYENIGKNETALGILSNVFGARAQTGAMNLIAGLEELSTLYGELSGGAAKGAAGKMAEGMMDTLYGDMETFQSKVEELKRAVGEELAPQARSFLNTLGGMVDSVTNMDDRKFTALVGGLKGIAVLGGGLTGAGIAIKTLGTLMTPGGRLAVGAAALTITLTALAGAMAELEEYDYKENFGNLELNEDDILNYAEKLNEQYASLYANVDGFKQALEGSVTAYEEASATYKSSLIENMIKGVDVSPGTEEYLKLYNMGKDVVQALTDGIDTAHDANVASVTEVFGDTDIENDPVFKSIMDAIEAGYDAAKERAASLGNELRKTLIDSVTNDGLLDADELAKIQSIMDELNQVMAEQAAAENYVKQQELLRKAQTLGLESTQDLVHQLQDANNENVELLQQDFDRTYYAAMRGYQTQIANGEITEEQAQANLAVLKSQQEKAIYSRTADNEKLILNTMEALLSGSHLYGTWTALQELGESYRKAGGIVTQQAANTYNQGVSGDDAADMRRYLQFMVETFGYENLQGYADAFMEKGDTETANRFLSLMDMWNALSYGVERYAAAGTINTMDYAPPTTETETYDRLAELLNGYYGEGSGMTPQSLADYIAEQRNMGLEPDWQMFFGIGSEAFSAFNATAQAAGVSITELVERAVGEVKSIDDYSRLHEAERTKNSIAQMRAEIADINENGYWARFGGNSWGRLSDEQAQARVQQIEANIALNQDALAALYADNGIEIPVTPYVEGTDAVEALQDQGVQVDVEGDAAELQATIDGADGQTLMEYVSGDATDLSLTIRGQDGQTLVENVTGNASDLAQIISSYNGRTITVNIKGNKLFGSGGRATEASTFAEDGPEWAIPEEHTPNTARLLFQAAEASGFTPEELAKMRMYETGGRATKASIFAEGKTAEWAIPEEHTPNTANLLMGAARASGFGIMLAEMPVTASSSSKASAGDDGGERMVQINYSPIIHADNADGVDQALEKDKRRFEQMLEERELYKSVVSYR